MKFIPVSDLTGIDPIWTTSTAVRNHGYLVYDGAMMRFDPRPKLASIRSKVLFVLSRTDAHFPPSIAPGVMAALEEAGVDARYFEID